MKIISKDFFSESESKLVKINKLYMYWTKIVTFNYRLLHFIELRK
jgi:hypothetical protein